MKEILILILLCGNISLINAQNENAFERNFTCNIGDTFYVGNDGVLRAEPNRSAKVLQDAKIGMMLICERNYDYHNQPKGEVIFNISSPFLAVKFESNGNWVSGYIWGGLIADVHTKDSKGNRYLLTRSSYHEDKHFFKGVVARVDAKTNQMVRASVDSIFSFTNSPEGKVLSGMGLSNVSSIFRVTYYGEACGIYTTSYYFAWDGKNLLQHLPTKNSMGDGGVYGYGEEVLFPSEHKQGDDLIIVRISESNYKEIYFEEIERYEYIGTTEETIKIYKWDGGKVRELKGKVEEEE